MIFFVKLIIFLLFAIIISIYDIKTYKIPLIVMYIGLIAGIVIDIFVSPRMLLFDIAAGLVNISVFLICRGMSKKGLGLGDVQYSLFCGFYSGLPFCIAASLLASLFGLFFYAGLKLTKKNIYLIKIPFAPFMSLGCFLSILISKYSM